jgi:oligosaccharide repeat unit polymerase
MPPVATLKSASKRLAAHAQPVSGTTRYPLLGITGTVIGTYLAVLTIPEDPEPKGALFNSALLMSLGLALAPLVAATRDPKSLLRGEHLLSLAPIYWLLLDLLQGIYTMEQIEAAQIQQAFFGIGLFVCAVWVSVWQRPWRMPRLVVDSVSRDFPANTFFGVAVLAFALGMLKFAIPCNFNVFEMFYYVGQSRWAAPWGRGALGGWDAFLDHMAYFGYLMPALTVILARRIGWLNGRTLLTVGMSLIMALFLAQGGGRRIIGVIFGMAIILWVLSEHRLKPRQIAILAGVAAVLLAVMQTMLEYRNVGFSAIFNEETGEPMESRDYLHVDDNFYRFCQLIQFIPEQYPHVYHKYFIWVFVRPIPRVFWPGKPMDPGFDLPTALGLTGVTFSASVIGDLYMAAGMFGIALGGWFYGRLAGMASRLLTQSATFGGYVIYAALMMALFAGVRTMLELVLVSYVVLAWVGLSRLFMALHARRSARS